MPGLPRDAIARLEEHAAGCQECAARVALERETYALLSSEVEPLAGFERARLWARIEGARHEPRRPWLGWVALASAIVAAISFLALRPQDPLRVASKTELASGDQAPRGAWLELEPGARIEVGRAKLIAETRTVLSVPESPEVEEIWIADGNVRVEAIEATPQTIVTKAGRLLVFASDSRIFVDGGEVEVEVERGRVELQPEQGPPRTATIGKREALSAIEAAVETPPIEAPIETPIETRSSERRAKPVDVESLMASADADRRAGNLAAAEKKYARAAEHPGGAPFREEASMRRASILAELGDGEAALALLDRTEGGKLLPERTALKARLLLGRGDARESAAVLERGGDHHVVDLARLDTARALLPTDPRRAHALLLSINREGALAVEARALAAQAEARMINR
jgi:hypothetical protein